MSPEEQAMEIARFTVRATLALAGLGATARASVLPLSDTLRGWFTPTTNDTAGPSSNCVVGFCNGTDCTSGPAEFRDFFTFTIPVLDGPIVSATLLVNTAAYNSQDASETYQITSIGSVFGF